MNIDLKKLFNFGIVSLILIVSSYAFLSFLEEAQQIRAINNYSKNNDCLIVQETYLLCKDELIAINSNEKKVFSLLKKDLSPVLLRDGFYTAISDFGSKATVKTKEVLFIDNSTGSNISKTFVFEEASDYNNLISVLKKYDYNFEKIRD